MPATTVGVIGCGPAGISFLHALSTRRQKLEKENDVEGLAKLPDVTVFECASQPGGVWRSERIETMALKQSHVDTTNVNIVNGKEKGTLSKSGSKNTLPSAITIATSSSCASDGSSSGGAPNSSKPANEEQSSGLQIEEDSDSEDSSSSDDSSFSSEDSDSSDESYVNMAPPDSDPNQIGSTNMYEALWTNGPKETFEFFDYTFQEHFGRCALPAYMPRQHILEYILKRATRNNPSLLDDSVRFNTKVTYVCYDDTINKFEFTIQDLITNEKTVAYYDKCIWAAGENGGGAVPKSIKKILEKNKYKGEYLHSSAAGHFLPKVKGKHILMVGDAYSAEDLALQAIKLGAEKISILSRSNKGICYDVGAWPENKVEVLEDWAITGVTEDKMGICFSESEYDHSKYKSRINENGPKMELKNVGAVIFCTGYEPNMKMLSKSLTRVFEDYEEDGFEDMPEDWTMPPNALTEKINGGKPVEPNTYYLDSDEASIVPGIYHGFLMSNTNMMFAFEGEIDVPLFGIDVCMWQFLAQLVGDFKLPSEAEMQENNTQSFLDWMNNPVARMDVDGNYYKAFSKMEEEHKEFEDYYKNPVILKYEMEAERSIIKRFTKRLFDASYPLNLGSVDELNEKGELLTKMGFADSFSRVNLEEDDGKERRTFRDVDPSAFISMHTGTPASPFKKLWMDLDDHDPNLFSVEE